VPSVAARGGVEDGVALVVRADAVVTPLHHRQLVVELLALERQHERVVHELVPVLREHDAGDAIFETHAVAPRLRVAVHLEERLDRRDEAAAVHPVARARVRPVALDVRHAVVAAARVVGE
jgi:hypothetical protein